MASVTPPSSYVPPQGAATSTPVDGGEQVPADIQRLPPSLASTDRALTLRGEVVGTNQDGSTRISTPRGPVDVKLPDPQPARGTNVEVSLPAGTPPRTATVTMPPQQQQPAPQQPTPQQPTTQQPTPQQPAPQPGTPLPQTPTGQTPPPPTQIPLPHTPVTPLPNPTVPGATQQPAPPQTPGAQPANPQAPNAQTPAAQTPGPQPQVSNLPSGVALLQAQQQQQQNQMGPGGLLNFLKTSMQSLLKTDPTLAAQRPLQLGQMARLTPMAPGQMLTSPTPTNTPPAAPSLTPGLSLPGTAPKLLTAAAATLQTAQAPATQQAIATTALGKAISFAPSGTPAPTNMLTRILLPVAGATPAPNGVPGIAITGQLATPALTPGIRIDAPLLPHQAAVTAPAGGMPTPAPQALDVRVSGMMPSMPTAVMQNANVANLLHGSPTAPVIFATVAGQTAQGLPVVEMPTFTTLAEGAGAPKAQPALMVLQFPAKGLAPATVLKLDILPGGPAQGAAATPAFATGDDGVTWEALDDLLRNTGTQSQMQGAQTALQTAMPKPGAAAFTAPVLMFMAALKGGDITAWMGERGLEAITRSPRRADALARIAGDFATTARKFLTEDARPTGEWRSIQLPMMAGDDLARVQLHYRGFERDAEPGETPGKKNGTRFVMDLALTRMGSMQIDGFSVGKKLDITLRSEHSLSPAMRETMRARYHSAVSGIGFAGELNFSAASDHKDWVVTDQQPVRQNS